MKKFWTSFAITLALFIVFLVALGAGGTLDQYIQRGALAQIIVTSGADTYVAEAPAGMAATAAQWRVKKISVSGSATVIQWADGDAEFDNVPGAAGAGLAALTYQ